MKTGIWKYADNLKTIDKEFQCSMNEGNTPIIRYSDIYIKRDDLNPTGSYKDRGVAYRISKAKKNGEKTLVISSTGNFAISMSKYAEQFGIKIVAFVPINISKEKENILKDTATIINKVDKPILQALSYAEQNRVSYVRQSTDEGILEGFKTLMLEVLENNIKFENILFPVSSGTLLLSTYQILEDLDITTKPRLIAVQTTYNTYIAREFCQGYIKSLIPSIATSLNVKLRPQRFTDIIQAIKKTNGSAMVVNEKDIIKTKKLLWDNDINVGFETSACYFASKSMDLSGNTLVISTGSLR